MQGEKMKVRFGTRLTRQQRIKLSKRIGAIRRELAQGQARDDALSKRAGDESRRCIADLKRLEEKMRRINEGFK
jgi:hypothetical protein